MNGLLTVLQNTRRPPPSEAASGGNHRFGCARRGVGATIGAAVGARCARASAFSFARESGRPASSVPIDPLERNRSVARAGRHGSQEVPSPAPERPSQIRATSPVGRSRGRNGADASTQPQLIVTALSELSKRGHAVAREAPH